jgi:hypothetical protein
LIEVRRTAISLIEWGKVERTAQPHGPRASGNHTIAPIPSKRISQRHSGLRPAGYNGRLPARRRIAAEPRRAAGLFRGTAGFGVTAPLPLNPAVFDFADAKSST